MAKGRKIIWTRGNCFQTKGCWYCFRAMRTFQCSTRTARAPFRHCCESSHAGSHWLPVPGICLLLHRCYRSIRGSKAQLLVSSWEPCCCECPVDPAETEPSSVLGPAQLCPTPRLISVLLSSEETPENSRPPSLPQSLLLGTQTQDAL